MFGCGEVFFDTHETLLTRIAVGGELFYCMPMQIQDESRPFGFYFLMVFLMFGTTFIGWNFGTYIGAVIGFLFSCLVNGYALRIKNH